MLTHDPVIQKSLFWQSLHHIRLPVHDLGQYFGARAGAYFGFMDVYTRSLMVPATISVLMMVVGVFVTIANTVCNSDSVRTGEFCTTMGMDSDT